MCVIILLYNSLVLNPGEAICINKTRKDYVYEKISVIFLACLMIFATKSTNQYLLSGLKMAAKKANSYNPYSFVRIGINAIISMVPNVQPQYLITGSNKVHCIPYVSKDEYIRYIYVYDQDIDEWRLCGAGNYARCNITNDIFTRPSSVIVSTRVYNLQYFYGSYNTIREEAVYWFAAQKQSGITAAPIDGVLKTIDLDYEENSSSMRIISINLAADQYPGNISLY